MILYTTQIKVHMYSFFHSGILKFFNVYSTLMQNMSGEQNYNNVKFFISFQSSKISCHKASMSEKCVRGEAGPISRNIKSQR